MQVASIKNRVVSCKCLWFQRLKLEYHKLLSTFAIKFNLRRYTKAQSIATGAYLGSFEDQRFKSEPTVGTIRNYLHVVDTRF